MKEFNIPTASYEVFDDPAKALSYIEEKNEYPVVIKADGLALGKGVIIAANHEEAKEGLHEIMEEKVFGTSGNHVVVEEFLTGPEVSVLAFVDGKTVVPMVSSMDHKRALTGIRVLTPAVWVQLHQIHSIPKKLHRNVWTRSSNQPLQQCRNWADHLKVVCTLV